MGQYFKVANIDKMEYLEAHKFGDGLKLLEFGASGCGTMLGLALLLRQSNEGGGGDIQSDLPIIGSWAGDRITIVGDYDKSELYQRLEEKGKDISEDVLKAMLTDNWIAKDLEEKYEHSYENSPLRDAMDKVRNPTK